MDYNKEEIDNKLAEVFGSVAKAKNIYELSATLIVNDEDEDYRKAAKAELLSRINKQS